MKRTIIKIDETLCNGCGACIKGCHEGALQMIDNKARIISELFCDGLGACIGECPVGAIELEEREAEPYSEHTVKEKQKAACGCPGGREMSFAPEALSIAAPATQPLSHLRQWPVQLHLLNPEAAYFHHADVVLAADCAAYTYADFHNRFMTGKTIAIACPKLDTGKESYIEKLVVMIDSSVINTLAVVIMEVPCCSSLLQLAHTAVSQANRKIPIKKVVIGIKGEVLDENWLISH